MSKIYKKLSIVFVMAFAIMLGCFTNVLAADSKNYVPKKDYSDNLIANYKFDETSGTTCVDSKGNYNGIYNGTTSVKGSVGNARSFNGTSDYIQFNNPVIPLGKKSIKLNVKMDTPPSNTVYLIDNSNGVVYGGVIYINSFGKIAWTTYKDNSSAIRSTITSTINICDGNWHTVLVTWDGATNANTVKMYIDDLMNIHNSTTANSIENQNAGFNLTIGKAAKSNGNYFKGYLDDIEIYNDVVEYESLNLSATSSTTNQSITLNWNKLYGATGYNVKRSTTQGSGYESIASNVTENTYNDTTVESGKTYYYIVTPIINGQEGTPSNEASATANKPTDNNGNAILTITMTNGNVKSYTVSMTKVNDFISWYNSRSSGSNGSPYYSFDKTDSLQPFSKKTEYVVFDKISSFEVDEYSK